MFFICVILMLFKVPRLRSNKIELQGGQQLFTHVWLGL